VHVRWRPVLPLFLSFSALSCEADMAELNVADAAPDVSPPVDAAADFDVADAAPDVSPPVDAAADFARMVAGLADRHCRRSAECGFLSEDMATCLQGAEVSIAAQLNALQPLVIEGRLRFNLAALDACLAQPFASAACWAYDLKLLCPTLFEGASGEGDACTFSVQCLGDGLCWPGAGERCGTCRPPAEAGEACIYGGCVAGTACVVRAGVASHSNLCAPLDLPEGAPCAEGICAEGLACVGRNGAPLTCEATVGLGESCQERSCARGLGCDRDFRCVELRTGNEGSECRPDGVTFCRSDLECDFNRGRCVVRPGPGEPCVGLACSEGAYCDEDDTCRQRLAIDSPCDLPWQCASPATCIEGRCAIPPPPPTDCGPTFSSGR